ncbi:class I glutamine amidotransferase-like protein [Acaromyces ingoldii]|uniref:Class I glutamine amidotransferase-like protein n=1 Tax=Acaromyces ingoldii TaxID=215250 RepID=A0A316YYD9_9BASI|nr:class I glutamine amidotransferase-like protein [Acaromyces ingoldii]PWN93784.1 class I glutamine amidotransferase-like protein [Acaromyces ingoldii]
MTRIAAHFSAAVAVVLVAVASTTVDARQKVLLYSRTAGYRHPSIPNAIAALEKLGQEHSFDTVHTENQEKFESQDWLDQFDAVVFVSASGEALNSKGITNFRKYIENGGGYFGIHEATDCLSKTPWYARLVGALFNNHPFIQKFTVNVVDPTHPSATGLPEAWEVYDEAYNFLSNPSELDKTYVLTADQSTIKENDQSVSDLHQFEGKVHPIAWYKEGDLLTAPTKHIGGGVDNIKHIPKKQRGTGGDGRAYYTALGHTKACWTDDVFLGHILGAMQWVLASPSIKSNNDTLPSSAPGSSFIGLGASPSSSTSGSSAEASGGSYASAGSGTGSGSAANSVNSAGAHTGAVLGAAGSATTVSVSVMAALVCLSAVALTLSTSV